MKHAVKRVLCALLLMLLISGNAIRSVSAEEMTAEEVGISEEAAGTEAQAPDKSDETVESVQEPEDAAEEQTAEEAAGGPSEPAQEPAGTEERIPVTDPGGDSGAETQPAEEARGTEDTGADKTAEVEEAVPDEEAGASADTTAPVKADLEEEASEEAGSEETAGKGMLRMQPQMLQAPAAAPVRAVDYPGIEVVAKGTVMDAAYASGIKWTVKSAVSFWAEDGYSFSIGNKVLRAAEYENAPPSIGKVVTWAILPESETASGHIGAWITNAGVYKGEPVDIRETFYWEPVIYGSEKYQPMIMVGFNYTSRNINNGFRDFNGYTVRYEIYKHTDHSAPMSVDTAVLLGDLDDYQQIHLRKSDCISRLQVTDDSRIYMTEIDGRYVGYAGNTSSIDYPEDSFRAELKGAKEFYLTFGMGCSQNIGFLNQLDPQCSADDRLRFIAGECRTIRDTFRTAANGDDWYGLYGLGYWNTRSFGSYTVPTPVKRASDADEKDAVKHTVQENETFTYQVSVTIPDEYADYWYDAFALTDTLPAGIVYLSSTVIDDGDNDVTSKFDITASGQTVTAALKNAKDADFYNNSYRWRINVRTEAGIRNGVLVNTAQVEVRRGGDTQKNPSNPVETTVLRSKKHVTTSVEGGTIDPSLDADTGTDVVIAFHPSEGRHLTNVLVDGKAISVKGDESSYTFSRISADHTIHVVFSVNTYRITTGAAGGSIDPAVEGIPFGESRTIRYAPDEGRFLTQVRLNGKDTVISEGQTQTVIRDIRTDQTLHAVFTRLPEKKVTDEQGNDVNGKVVAQGNKVVYTITLFNDGDKECICTVRDTVQDGLEFISADQGGIQENGRIIWKNIRVPASGSASVSFMAMAVRSGRIMNEAEAEYSGIPGSVKTGQTVIFVPEAPVKDSASGGQVLLPGDLIVYTITASNPCDEGKEITITDILPEFAEFVSADQNGICENGTVTWKIQAAPRSVVKVELTVRAAPDSAGAILRNSAAVTLDGVTMRTGEIVNPIQEKPVKAVMNEDGISIDGRSTAAGSILYYTVSFRNPAPVVKVYTVEDSIPSGCSFVSAAEGGRYDSTEGTVSWNIQTAPGETREVSFVVRAGQPGSAIDNTASVSVDSICLDTNRTVNAVLQDPVKTVSDAQDPDRRSTDRLIRTAGSELEYTISVYNPFTVERSVTLTDTLPDGAELIAAEPEAEVSGEGGRPDSTLAWKLELGPQESRQVHVKVRVSRDAEDRILENRAFAEFDDAVGSNAVSTPVQAAPRKEVLDASGRLIDGEAVFKGQILTYRVRFRNPAAESKEYTVTDRLPQGLRFMDASDGGTFDGQNVRWTLHPGAGEETAVTFRAEVTEENIIIRNQASAAADGRRVPSNEVLNAVPKAPVKQVRNEAGTEIDKEIVREGDILIYEITVQDPFDHDMVYRITDELPQCLSFISADPAPAAAEDGKLTFEIRLQAGETGTVRIRTKVRENSTGSVFRNKALAESGTYAAETGETVNAVLVPPVKKVTGQDGKDAGGQAVTKGEILTYSIELDNPAEWEASFAVTDPVPEGTEVELISDGGRAEAGEVRWTLTLAPGEKKAVKLQVRPRKDGIWIRNQAEVHTDHIVSKTNETENVVPQDPVKTVAAADGRDIGGSAVFAGARLIYRIRFSNPFDSAREFTVTDRLPDGTVFEACSDGGSYAGGIVTWLVTVPAGEEKILTLEVIAGSPAGGTSSLLVNQAEVSVDQWKAKTGEVTNSVAPAPVKEVFFRDGRNANGQTVQIGDELTYRITVANPDRVSGSLFVVRDYFQSERLSFISADNGGRLLHDENGDKVRWEFTLGPGGTKTVSFTVKVIRNDHTIGNIAEADLNGSTAVSNSVACHPAAPPVKRVLYKGADAEGCTVPAGESVEYRITVKNPCDIEREFTLEDQAAQYLSFKENGQADNGRFRTSFRLAPYEEREFVVRAVTNTDTPDGTAIVNTAYLRCADTGLASNETRFTVSGSHSASVSSAGVRTGDSRKTLLWAGLLGAGLAALGLWNRRRKRQAGRL